MIQHTEAVLIIILISITTLISLYLNFVKKNRKFSLFYLFVTGFVLRLAMIFIDPFLHNWDERFHALVAKNLIKFPFKPMLRINPILPYKVEDWCCNHIWVHKQPIFLWQSAVSMKIFGINEIALRLPSVIMGSLSILLIYDIALFWIKNRNVAYIASFLFAFSYYQLELTSGRFGLDLNDTAFSFYMTASIWSFIRYLKSNFSLKWVLITGVFVGIAILNKWLTGLLIFGGWGLFLLLSKNLRFDNNKWIHLIIAFLTSVIIFLPWQVYILNEFPVESSIMFDHNKKHIFEVLGGHNGNIWYHINQLRQSYGQFLLPFFFGGGILLFKENKISKELSIAFISMVIVIFSFFSILVQTKMPAFTYPVYSIVWIIIALGINVFLKKIKNIKFMIPIILLLIGVYTLKPWRINEYRNKNNIERMNKIHNTLIYKNFKHGNINNRIIINCKSFEDVELMFYQDVNAYHWFPKETTIDSLISKGYKFAAFKNHNNQYLPAYINNNKDIVKINDQLK